MCIPKLEQFSYTTGTCGSSRKLVSDFSPICANPLISVVLRLESRFPSRPDSHALHDPFAVDQQMNLVNADPVPVLLRGDDCNAGIQVFLLRELFEFQVA